MNEEKVIVPTPVAPKKPTFGNRYDHILRDEIDFAIEKYTEWIVKVIYSYVRQREKLLTATPLPTVTITNNDRISSTKQTKK